MSADRTPIEVVLERLKGVKQTGEKQWIALCPAHDDTNPSLTVGVGHTGNVVVCCQSRGCSFPTIAAAMNLPQSAFFATVNGNNHLNDHGKRQGGKKGFRQTAREARDLSTWMVQQKNPGARMAGMWWYHDAEGKVVAAVIRYDLPDKRKEFRPISIHPDGWCVRDPIGQWPLYRLPEIIANPTAIVCVFEGEKKTEAAAGIGLMATTSAHGSKSPAKTDWSILAGKDVAIFPDKDESGEEFTARVRSIVHRLTPPAKVRIVRLPGLQHKEDMFEFVQMRETDGNDTAAIKEEVLALINAAPYEELPGSGQGSAPLNDGEPLPAQDAAARRPPPSNEPPTDVSAESDPVCMTDVGSGKRFVADHGAIARYCGPWEAWLFWDGRRWCTDETVMAQKLAKRTIMQSYKSIKRQIDAVRAGTPANADNAAKAEAAKKIKILEAVLDWFKKSQERGKINAMIEMARSEDGIPIVPSKLDQHPWYLNVLNGTIDLRTAKIQSHSQADHITQIADVIFDPTAKCPIWDKFVLQIFGGRESLTRYMARLAGLWLTGVTTEHALPILWGSGSNGKSTFIKAIFGVMGRSYSGKAPRSLLIEAKTEQHPTAMAWLFGRRFVSVMETKQGARLDEALLKELTGGDQVTARRMQENFWSFDGTHKIALVTNHRPEVRGVDHAIWRRLRLIPFTVTFEGQDKDLDLPEKLAAERSGILNWMICGCLEWQRNGLQDPPEVIKETANYRAAEDVVGQFLEDCCLLNPNVNDSSTELYGAYKVWAENGGERPMSSKVFCTAMRDRKFEDYRSNGVRFKGIAVKPGIASTTLAREAVKSIGRIEGRRTTE